MPINDMINSSDLKPSYIAKPDMRFGTTFLSTQYRQFAVKGESIMDKATGEIFTKRKEDGKVVSFFQNKKYMHDMLLELRVLLNNNPTFVYPRESETAYYVSRDFDLVTINDEVLNDLLVNDITIPNDSYSYHKMVTKVSGGSNGFFIRLMSRDTDKATVNFLSSQYNQLLKNYSGSNTTFLAEKNKFKSNTHWEDSDVTMLYTLTITKNGASKTYSLTDYIRVNEETCVMFPQLQLETDFPDGYDYATVEINSFDFYKMHFMVRYGSQLSSTFTTELKKFQYLDNNVYINYCNICNFIDKSTDVTLYGNEFIIAFMDVPYLKRYLDKMSKLDDMSDFVLSPTRPAIDIWRANGLWAELIRDVSGGGITTDRKCEVDLSLLEEYLADDNDAFKQAEISTDSYMTDDIYFVDPTKTTYTTEEVNTKMASLMSYVSEEASKAVSDTAADLTDNGLLMDTESITEE